MSLTPRTMTAAQSEAALQSIRSSRFFERDKDLYQLRRKYVRTAAGLDRAPRPVHKPEKSANFRPNPQPEERVPLLCIGNWQKPTDAPSLRLTMEGERGTLHTLPAALRVGERGKVALAVKSLELEAGPKGKDEALLKSEAYQSCLALFSTPHSPSSSSSPLESFTPPSPPAVELQTQRLSARRCEGNCGHKTRDVCLRTRPASEAFSYPKFTSITPQIRAMELPVVPAFPCHTPLRLHRASKTHIKPLDFRQAFAQPASPSNPSSQPSSRKSLGLKSVLVELRPKDLPPHRIPVDYALFRRVYKKGK